MKCILLRLFHFLVLTSAAVIAPLVPLNTSEIVRDRANRPAVRTPDPRFRFDASFNGPKLPLVSTLQNTVDFLMLLGLEDFSGSMEGMAWKAEDYPEVGMVISPSTDRERIEIRFVIWGLSQGAAYMIHSNRFQAITFTLSCTFSLLSFTPNPDVSWLEAAGHLSETGTICRSKSDPQTCLLTSSSDQEF